MIKSGDAGATASPLRFKRKRATYFDKIALHITKHLLTIWLVYGTLFLEFNTVNLER